MKTVVSVVGRVFGSISDEVDRVTFTIRNDEGIILVEAPKYMLPDNFSSGERIHVAGTLGSFLYHRCRNNHVLLKAISISPVTAQFDPAQHFAEIIASLLGE